MKRSVRFLGGIILVVMVLLLGLAQVALAAAPDWSDNFDGGAQQTWAVADMGDNSTHVVQNNRYELHTESTGGAAKALIGYVDVSASNYTLHGRVQQMVSGDNFLAYLMARTTVATGSGYLLGASSDGAHFWFGKLVGGAYQELTPSYIEAATFDVTDFHLKFMVFGSTLLGKVWSSSGSEPDHWQIKATDSSYTSGAGGVMIATYPTLGWNVVQAAFDDVSLSTPSEVWVDDGWSASTVGDIVSGHTFGYDAFATVQSAVNAVNAGGTVHVAAGTYNERLNISKSLDLRGAQYGVDPTPGGARTVPANESVIDLTGLTVTNPNILIEVPCGVSDVTIDGFTLIGSPALHYADEDVIRFCGNNVSIENNIVDGYYGVHYRGTGSGAVVSHNRMTVNKVGITVQTGVTNATFSGNKIVPGAVPAADASAIYLTGSVDCTISDNVLTGFSGGNGVGGSNQTRLTLSGNTISGCNKGINFWGSTTFVTIENNTISGCTTHGINIKGQDITIEDNNITGNGIGIAIDKHTLATERVTVYHNTLSGNSGVGLSVTVAVVETVDAEHNYWGSIVPVEVVAEVSGNADYDPWCNSDFTVCDYSMPVHNLTQLTDHPTIQSAIDAATAGDHILVDPGIYREHVILNKSVTVTGDRGDANVAGPGPNAPILDGDLNNDSVPDKGDGFTIPANTNLSGITVEGFIIRSFGNGGGGNGVGVGVISWENTSSNVTIRDNLFTNLGYNGVYVGTDTDDIQSNWLVQRNIVEGAPYAGIELTDVTNSQVLDNEISAPAAIFDDPGDAGVGIEIAARARNGVVTTSDVLVKGNTITGAFAAGSRAGINILARAYTSGSTDARLSGITVEGNVVSGSGTRGIYVVAESRGGNPSRIANLAITQNTLTGNTAGVEIGLVDGSPHADGTYDVATNTIQNNDLEGNTVLGLRNLTDTTIDASGNWYGTADPAGVAALVSAYVDYTPWLEAGTDTSTDPGFQGDFSTLWVDDDSPQTGTTGRIQEGINLVSGSTVNVAAGTYPETLVLDDATPDDLTIQGEATRPELTGGVLFDNDTNALDDLTLKNLVFKGDGEPSVRETILYMSNSAAVNDLVIDNCVFDGENVAVDSGLQGRNGIAGNKLGQSFTVTNSEFKNILGWALLDMDASSDYTPIGGNGLPLAAITFSNNSIHDCNGSVALRGNHTARTTQVDVIGNTWNNIGGVEGYTGGQWAALELNNAAQVNIKNNTINDVQQGVYGEGEAIQFWNVETLDVSGNFITNNYQGIYFYSDGVGGTFCGTYGCPVPGGSVTSNSITGNTMFGIKVEAVASGGPLDASCNWWGTNTPAGVAALVSANVDYTPWLASGTDTSTDPGFQGDFSTLWVDDDSPQTGATGRIQEGINLVSGSTVNVAAGLYVEDISISKALTLLGPKSAVRRDTGSELDWTSSKTAAWTATEATAAGEAVIRSAAVVADKAVVTIAEDFDVTVKGFVIEARNRTDGTNAHLIYVKGQNTTIQTIVIENNIIGPITGDAQDGNKGRFGLAFDSQSGGPNGLAGSVKGNKILGAEGNGANVFIIGQHYKPSMSDYSGMVVEYNDVYGANRSGMELVGGLKGLTVQFNTVIYNGYIWNGSAYVQSSRAAADPNNILYGAGINLIRSGTICGVVPASQNAIEDLGLFANIISNNEKSGVYVDAQQRNLTIMANVINGNGRDGIWLDEFGTYNESKAYNEAYGYIQDASVLNNVIVNSVSPYAAVRVTGKPPDLAINSNDLRDNDLGVIQEDGPAQSWDYTANATCNWWGSAVAADVQAMISGDVDATPYLMDGTDIAPASRGFQPGGACTGGPVKVYSDLAETTLVDTYFAIQSAIDDATTLNGYVVRAEAGTYAEHVVINKAVSVRGAVGAIIDGGGTGIVVDMTANGATLEGFTIRNSGTTGTDAGVRLYNVTGCTVESNTVTANALGIVAVLGSGNSIGSNAVSGNAYYGVALVASTGNTIELNNVTGNGLDAIALDNASAVGGAVTAGATGNFIKGNTITSNRDGIFLGENCDGNSITDGNALSSITATGVSAWRSDGHTITDNVISGAATGIRLLGSSNNTITGNFVTGNGVGIKADASWQIGVWYQSASNTIADNDISGNTTYGVQCGAEQTDVVNASGNWWGSADPATVKAAANGGTLVDYTPWLAAGTDTSTDPGFQGDFSTLWVDDDSPQTGTTGRIQEGIDRVSGSTVNVAAGTYTEQVTINKDVDLIGAGEATTTLLAPAVRTGSVTQGAYVHDYLLAAYATSGTIDVRIEGFTLDVNAQNKTAGTDHLDGVFFRDVKNAGGTTAGLFSSTIHNFATTPEYESWGMAIYGDSLLTVDDNDISDYTRDGISVYGNGTTGPAVTISGNTVTGSATGLNGIGVMDGATGSITGNIVTGNTRSAPWAGVGIGVWSDGLVVTGNQVNGNFYGIDIYSADGTAVSNNTLTDNVSRGITLDAANNNTVSDNTITGPVGGTDDVAIGLANGCTGNMIGGPTAADGNTIVMATSGYWTAPPLLYAIHVANSVGAGSNTIQYNTITGGKRGIQVDGGNTGTTTIANNTLNNTPTGPEYPTFGIGINGGSASITGNTLNDTVRPMEVWGATDLTIEDNIINLSTFAAINLGGFSGTATVSGNTIHGLADASGIWAQTSGAGLSIAGNLLYDISGTGAPGYAGRGIQIDGGADGANIDGNEVYNITGFAGIVIDTGATGVKINNNYVHDNVQGMAVNDLTAEFNSNRVVNNRWGIDLWSPTAVTWVLRSNQIAGNNTHSDSYGLTVWAGTADAEYNWWGDATGPFDLLGSHECAPGNCSADATLDVNLDGLGNKVSEDADYCPWLDDVPPGAGTQLYLDPAFASVLNNNTATQTYTVRIANAVDLYGYQFVVTFDPANMECTAAAFDDTFLTNPASTPSSWNAFVDNTTGKVYFARSRQYPDLGITGNGPLATLTFRGKSGATAGQYKLDFELVRLGDIDGDELPITAQFGWLELYDTGSLAGSVDLQGRSNESGGVVTILSSTGYTATTTITAADGSWSFANIPAGNYQVNIEMERYLDAQAGDASLGTWVTVTGGTTTTLAKVKLLGGDANNDDVVDILDAGIIGGQFGKSGVSITDPRADINADGIVDILDLVLMAGNYTKTSPVPWTP